MEREKVSPALYHPSKKTECQRLIDKQKGKRRYEYTYRDIPWLTLILFCLLYPRG